MASGSEQYAGINAGRASRGGGTLASKRGKSMPKQGTKNTSNPKSADYTPF